MKQIKENLKECEEAIKHPSRLGTVALCLLTAILAISVMNWIQNKTEGTREFSQKQKYEGGIESEKLKHKSDLNAIESKYVGTIKTTEARIASLQDVISEYRERLGLSPADGNPYSKLTHKELKNKLIKLVNKIEPLAIENEKQKKAFDQERSYAMNSLYNKYDLSKEEDQQAYHEHSTEIFNKFYQKEQTLNNKINLSLKENLGANWYSEILLLREEMLSRIPQKRLENLKKQNLVSIGSWNMTQWSFNSQHWTLEVVRELIILANCLTSENS